MRPLLSASAATQAFRVGAFLLVVLSGLACSDRTPTTTPGGGPTQAPLDEDGAWVSRGGLPEALSGSAAAVWREHIYVLGGFAETRGGSTTRHVVRIDPESLQTERLSDYPDALAHASLVVYRDTLLAVGGIRGDGSSRSVSSTIRWYDAGADSWAAWGLLPDPRGEHVAEAIGDFLFVVGGGTGVGPDSVVRYDGRVPTHLPPANRLMTEPLAGGALGDTIIILSSWFESRMLRLNGREGVWLDPIGLPADGEATGGILNGRVHSFQLGPAAEHRIWAGASGSWLRARPPNTPVESAAVVAYLDRLYLIGGLTADGTSVNRIQVYTPNP